MEGQTEEKAKLSQSKPNKKIPEPFETPTSVAGVSATQIQLQSQLQLQSQRKPLPPQQQPLQQPLQPSQPQLQLSQRLQPMPKPQPHAQLLQLPPQSQLQLQQQQQQQQQQQLLLQPQVLRKQSQIDVRAAGKKISCGVKADQVVKTPHEVLFHTLIGVWDPLAKKYANMANVMTFMEAGISLGGGPVRKINFTQRVKQIAFRLSKLLGARPSDDITNATCLAIYELQPFVKQVIQNAVPQTGGEPPSEKIAQLQLLSARIDEFARSKNEHETSKMMISTRIDEFARVGKYSKYPRSKAYSAPLLQKLQASDAVFGGVSKRHIDVDMTTNRKNKKSKTTDKTKQTGDLPEFENYISNMFVDSMKQRQAVEMKVFQQQKEIEIQLQKISAIQKQLDQLNPGSDLWKLFKSKIVQLVEKL